MDRQLLLYLPVIHTGYEQLLDSYHRRAQILLLGRSFATRYPAIRKDIRAVHPLRLIRYLRAGYPGIDVRVVEIGDLPEAITAPALTVPDEQLLLDIVRDFGLAKGRRFGVARRSFLRWDRKQSERERTPIPDVQVAADDIAREYGAQAAELGELTTDWWRAVGAIAVRDRQVLVRAHNRHLPSEYAPYIHGDPRGDYRRGLRADLTTALHAEAAVVAEAARDGVPLRGADLFVSTFPCANCARLIASAGFSRCYYVDGYSTLDGLDVLRAAGVEIIQVKLDASGNEQLSLHRP